MTEQTTDRLATVAQFVNSTGSHIFLTGKAGTGKTTFLRNLAESTHKNYVIVAPTGIAALNAKGVTIHSQFLLPFGTFIPERKPAGEFGQVANFYTSHTLGRRHNLNSDRKKVLRSLDLLIIDEVSMLRADILDAIDYRLRSAKGNFQQPFGGVQLLMIGDLHQLPPIVKDNEWNVLKNYYQSPHFFEAKALSESGFVYLELDKIFRQSDDKFIQVLNHLRNDICTAEDIAILNEHFEPNLDAKNEEEIITLTTHNYRADRINRSKLDALPGESHFFKAEIEDDFPSNIYPASETLEVKKGTQLMFIKNDSMGGQYYNGKLATVTEIDNDEITVKMAESEDFYTLQKETWENQKYTVNDETKELEEETVGTFTHYPVKLAWAITVHKSQGLTFDKAVIDVGEAFAPGQVYVALSRLRSLDGLRLRTKIQPHAISCDKKVVQFSEEKNAPEKLPQLLKQNQSQYLQYVLNQTFDFSVFVNQIQYVQNRAAAKMEFEDEEMNAALRTLEDRFIKEAANTAKFRNQLLRLLHNEQDEMLFERIRKGKEYYTEFVKDNLQFLLLHLEYVGQFSQVKTYKNALDELDQMLMKKWGEIEKIAYVSECIFNEKEIEKRPDKKMERLQIRAKIQEEVGKTAKENPKNSSRKSGRRRKLSDGKKDKATGKTTYEETFEIYQKGKSIAEIAAERGLAETTIENHLARGIKEGKVDVHKILQEKEIKKIQEFFTKNKEASLGEIFNGLNQKYSYGKLRMVQASLDS